MPAYYCNDGACTGSRQSVLFKNAHHVIGRTEQGGNKMLPKKDWLAAPKDDVN